jgi:paired amphipathic helix protein Sin3a
MCWEVLNDEWVSHPTWASEDAVPSAAHKRNAYEEALHKTEEERHEYDYHIEANIRTIALLEPLNARIKEMDELEKAQWKLKPGLGGQSKSIYQRILKKIYGREQGLEVIAALHEQPAMAIPVVLARLKQKDEEWKKAQREWNKVWREVDAKNFYKSLDHQGVVFKANDKKALAAKTLIAEIEALRKEQTQRQAVSGESATLAGFERGQYKFSIEDIDCLQDALKLSFSYLDRMTLAAADRDRVETFMRTFVPLFFQFDASEYDATFGESTNGSTEDDGSELGDGASDAGSLAEDDDGRSSTVGKKNRGKGDLRTKLLRQVVEAGEKRGKRSESVTPAVPEATLTPTNGSADIVMTDAASIADAASVNDDKMNEDEDVAASRAAIQEGERTWVAVDAANAASQATEQAKPVPRRWTFFGNNNYFCFFRMLQVSPFFPC